MTTTTGPGQTPAPGDLGRRVAHRRRELGSSREQLAERAGMATGYLDYLEEQAARVPPAGLMRLALALNTTRDELLGGAAELPPGQRGPAPRPKLETLSPDPWHRHLAAGALAAWYSPPTASTVARSRRSNRPPGNLHRSYEAGTFGSGRLASTSRMMSE
jgi:transcriptional regulator with XRE-family HTH domain